MLNKLYELLRKYRDLIIYLLLGVGTTAVNFAVYYPLLNICGFSATVSNVVAWFASVLFAFATNKPLAFKSTDWSLRVTLPELIKFLGCRVGSGIFETLFLAITVDILLWNGNIMKILVSVFVVIANYIASKYFVFRKKKSTSE